MKIKSELLNIALNAVAPQADKNSVYFYTCYDN